MIEQSAKASILTARPAAVNPPKVAGEKNASTQALDSRNTSEAEDKKKSEKNEIPLLPDTVVLSKQIEEITEPIFLPSVETVEIPSDGEHEDLDILA